MQVKFIEKDGMRIAQVTDIPQDMQEHKPEEVSQWVKDRTRRKLDEMRAELEANGIVKKKKHDVKGR